MQPPPWYRLIHERTWISRSLWKRWREESSKYVWVCHRWNGKYLRKHQNVMNESYSLNSIFVKRLYCSVFWAIEPYLSWLSCSNVPFDNEPLICAWSSCKCCEWAYRYVMKLCMRFCRNLPLLGGFRWKHLCRLSWLFVFFFFCVTLQFLLYFFNITAILQYLLPTPQNLQHLTTNEKHFKPLTTDSSSAWKTVSSHFDSSTSMVHSNVLFTLCIFCKQTYIFR